jgi:hypothetical protein
VHFSTTPKNAKAQGRCGRKAPEAFAALSKDQKNQIQARLVSVLDLLDLPAIADLKKAQGLRTSLGFFPNLFPEFGVKAEIHTKQCVTFPPNIEHS